MVLLAFNGSPRKKGTTVTLLDKVLEGARSVGAETELIHLNKLNMRGCQSCFACKKTGGKHYGKCKEKDDLTPIYEKLEQADAMIVGSPIYFGAVTAQTKLFIDRLFPYLTYKDYSSIFPKKIPVGLVYTMNADSKMMRLFDQHLKMNELVFSLLFGGAETLISLDTYHVDDYDKIEADAIQAVLERKLKHKKEVFPLDCEKAFEMGARFARKKESTKK